MIRWLILAVVVAIPFWAPWMDGAGRERTLAYVFERFGPLTSTCFDSEGNEVFDGVDVRWYPFGRLVHTCNGDFVVWVWDDASKARGARSSSAELMPAQSRPLSCEEVLRREEVRHASTTPPEIYAGAIAQAVDFSLMPQAAEFKAVITDALRKGPNFAGKFAVAEWECGSNCQRHAVVDVESGRVVAFGPDTEFGVSYALDTTLLTTNPLGNLPQVPESDYDAESQLFSIARVPREYYRLTHDALSNTQYLVKLCTESAATGYVGVLDDQLGVPK